jgi:hypothetical protein
MDLGAAIEQTLLVIDIPTEDVSEQVVGVVETDFDLVLLTFPLDTAFRTLSVTGRRHATVAGDNCSNHRDACQRSTEGGDDGRRTRRLTGLASLIVEEESVVIAHGLLLIVVDISSTSGATETHDEERGQRG